MDIDKIIFKKLFGSINSDEEEFLEKWLAQDEKHKKDYDNLLKRNDLSARYAKYNSVDDEKAWNRFKSKHYRLHVWKIMKYASIVVLLFTTSLWFMHERDKQVLVKKEVKIQTVKSSLALSKEEGHQKAIIKIGKEKEKYVQSVKEYEKLLSNVSKDVMYTLQTENGDEFWITLDDGTKVHINYGSSLKYPSTFDSRVRMVSLTGEAYFKVAKDNTRPFIVMTPNGEVKQYGTEFNINTYSSGNQTDVVLIEGSISVKTNNGVEHMMKPGELAQLNNENLSIKKVDIAPYKAWHEGEYIFRNSRMDVLMDVLGHWYNLNIEYKNLDSKEICFTGSIDKYGNIDSILKAIEKVTGLDIEKVGNTIIIK